MKKTPKLTQGQRQYLEHARRARDRGISFSQYCGEAGLPVQSLYNANSALKRNATRSTAVSAARNAAGAGGFLAVRIAPPTTQPRLLSAQPASPTLLGGACRVRSPSGWIVECPELPPASWMTQLLSGGTYVGN